MKKNLWATLIAIAYAPLTASLTYADTQTTEDAVTTEDVTVRANRFKNKESDTTYAAEIHTRAKIQASNATTLYEYLSQQSSLNIQSNYGNKATPNIDMRGFGTGNGAQNIVITLDGQRLNNIDGVPQLLGAIPLGNIERIEISKGSGSVVNGDGATAGSIQIYTKALSGVSASTSFGNYGQQNHVVNAGLSQAYFDLSASVAHDSQDGFSDKDNTGHRDEFTGNTQNIKFKLKPNEQIRFIGGYTSAYNDVYYINSMTLAQFNANPAQNGQPATSYTHQKFISNQWQAGLEIDLSSSVQARAMHYGEKKQSNYITYANLYNYTYASDDFSLAYTGEQLNAVVGVYMFDGDRKASNNTTTKNNQAWFINTEYRPTWLSDALTVSAGFRDENVDYRYAPTTGTTLAQSKQLQAWDMGLNYRFNQAWSAFANYNKAFQAPDIDRFFTTSGTFNGIIQPMQTRTFNTGLHYVTPANRLKVSAFHTNLDNEIYYNNVTGNNTNIDQSHKYGLEVQDFWKISDTLNASAIYTYTRALIDREDQGNGQFNGKNLPGVPKHGINANLNWQFYPNAVVNLNQVWRSEAFAYNDFANNLTQKQQSYKSTNLSVNYQYKNYTVFGAVNNLFEAKNSIQIEDNVLYPIDFARTVRIGLRADF